jgi:lipoprotein signal peptidase
MRTAAKRLPRPRPASLRVSPLRLHGARRHWASALCLAVVLVDQATKAVQPTGTFVVNTGAAAILPSALGDALWNSPTLGAACDVLDTVLLLVALNLTRRLNTTKNRVAATAVLAGLFSNLADRLGTASLFHAGLPRGAVDWIPVPLWPTARTNLADLVIALGVLALGYRTLRHAALVARTVARYDEPSGPGTPPVVPNLALQHLLLPREGESLAAAGRLSGTAAASASRGIARALPKASSPARSIANSAVPMPRPPIRSLWSSPAADLARTEPDRLGQETVLQGVGQPRFVLLVGPPVQDHEALVGGV